jgi:hypothetical protein
VNPSDGASHPPSGILEPWVERTVTGEWDQGPGSAAMVMPSTQFRTSMGDTPSSAIEWAWTEALAVARPGTSYRLARIPFSIAREQCAKLGCAEGDCLVCKGNGGGMLVLERDDGRRIVLNRVLAWYIQAEVCSPGGSQ